MKRWRVSIDVYAHSTGAGDTADKEAAGAGLRYFYCDAKDFRDACDKAMCFSDGVASHPRVWMALITGVHVYTKTTEPETAC